MNPKKLVYDYTIAVEGDVYRTMTEWSRLLGLLRELGPVLMVSRTESAILGRHLVYPRFEFVNNNIATSCLSSDSLGMLQHNLALWEEGWVWKESVDGVSIEAFEFADLLGRGVHKVCATESTDLRAWEQVVREACTHASDAFDLLHLRKTNHLDVDTRIDEVSERHAVTQRFLDLFNAAGVRAAVIGIVIPNPASTIGGCFVPSRIQLDGPWVKMETATGELFFFKPCRISEIVPVGLSQTIPGVPTFQLDCLDSEGDSVFQMFLCQDALAKEIEELLASCH